MGTMVRIFFGWFFSWKWYVDDFVNHFKKQTNNFFLNISGYHNGGSDINYDSEVPNPPQDNNQVAAWYDTDL